MERQKLAGRSILIVEPDPFIAVDIQDALADEGARVVTAFRLQRALQLAERPRLSAAVIDCTLGVEDQGALCLRLRARNVPFIFHSKRLAREQGEWADVPLITKTAGGNAVVEAVTTLLGGNGASPGPGRRTQRVRANHS
jgi:DNA-binding response OmpR family regulator